jgi:uncharacterized protein YndB with AHSA1/START domain
VIRVDIHETIRKPVEQVFARLVDIGGYREWRPGGGGIFLTCSQDSPGAVGEGTRYTDRTRLGTVRGEVAVFDPPRRVIFHYTSRLFGRTMIEGWPGYTLESDGAGGTRLHHHAEARTYGPFRLLEPLIQRIANRERAATVRALKESFD